jgi:hypothetical protein
LFFPEVKSGASPRPAVFDFRRTAPQDELATPFGGGYQTRRRGAPRPEQRKQRMLSSAGKLSI